MSEEQVQETGDEAAAAEAAAEPGERDYESEARNMGWHDPNDDDFKGDASKALDAKAFVEKGENELPVLKANLRKLQNKVTQQDADREEFKNFMNQQFEASKAEHEAKLREAVSDGDTERYDELQKAAPKPPAPAKEVSAIEAEFASRNDWYGVDDQKTKLAMAADQSLKALRGILSPEKYVDRLEAEMERLMPTKDAANTVITPRLKPKGSGKKTFEGMPPDIKATCKRMEKEWNIKREDYVKNYYDGLDN